jgi:hypothetical protein
MPCLASPRRASPRRATPRLPRPASPRRAWPRLALPRLAKPGLVVPHLAICNKLHLTDGVNLMKTAPSGLVTLLGTGQFVFADLYQFTLITGQVLRYTTADVDIVYSGNTYSSALFFDQSGNKAVGHWKTGLDVDTWQVYVMPVEFDPVTLAQFPIKIGNTPWLAAVAAGALTGAQVDIHRAYWSSWPQPWVSPLAAFSDGSGTYVIVDYFAGRTAAIDIMRNQAVISVNSWLDQFKLMMPRNLWQDACRWTLFDAGCTLSQGAFAFSGTAQPGSTQSQIVTVGLGQPSGYFALGQVTMTSGLNSGFRRTVKAFDGTTMQLIAPFPFALATGDAFTAYPGCDKSLATCTNKFANAVNFGGEDLIPNPETAV